MEQGILFIAVGDAFRREATISAERMNDVMDDVSISIYTDEEVDSPHFDNCIISNDPDYGFGDQIEGMRRTPYDRTLCLDTDIYLDDSIQDVFELLTDFEIAAAFNPATRGYWEYDEVPESFPEYNTGVVAFRNTPEVQEFITRWEKQYQSERERTSTEPAFRKTLYQSNLRVATLPPEYNCQIRHPGHVVDTVKIFHGRLIDIDLKEERLARGKHQDMEKAVEKINSVDEPRVFTQLGGLSVYSNKTESAFHRVRMALRRGGIGYVLRRGFQKFFSRQ